MTNIHRKLKTATTLVKESIKYDGPVRFSKRSAKFIYYRQFPEKRKEFCKDILIINGCTLEHPTRYRVYHQIEQLRAGGMTADHVFYDRLNRDMLKYYRGFIFFRCPITDEVRDFIAEAKAANKTCFFDIDDLVIDKKYTDRIKYVAAMQGADRELYDDGVKRMGETFQLCDSAITTTVRLRKELESYGKTVYINRNVASDEMVKHSLVALESKPANGDKVVIGYFSGSITHNEDFELILPSLTRLLRDRPNTLLAIAGILDIPRELQEFSDRVRTIEFKDWRQMPNDMAACDINLAPIVDSIFNEAKSENKWLEAALVQTVTLASNRGAFKEIIRNGETGWLVDDKDWYKTLVELVDNEAKRQLVAKAAHKEVLEHHTTINSGAGFAAYIRSKLARNIAFVLPSTDISGGVNVVLKHAAILRKHGWDVTLLDAASKEHLKKASKQYAYRYSIPGYNVILARKTDLQIHFDTMVATLWSTVKVVKKYPNTKHRLFFVQNLETGFYVWGSGEPKILANAAYCDDTNLRYITMSLWCQKWLKERYGKTAQYASNGLDLEHYPFRKRSFSGKIHILVEGDSKDEYKNTDEAFRIIEQLDPAKFEVSYLSYRKNPKDWYRVDHFYNRIAPEKVGEVFASCDILIKTSLLESFSYPPLEMMATGGIAVVVPNDGNVEYLRDGENCLFYQQGNIADGVAKIKQIIADTALRQKLIKGGVATAQKYQWANIEPAIVGLYE